jgi:imidazolonepropionase-like amidohydrolase
MRNTMSKLVQIIRLTRAVAILVTASFVFSPVVAQDEQEPKRVMFTNVNVFDGVNETLDMNTNVLIEDNLIKSIGASITLPAGTDVIDGGGRTLMPGLIEGHGHLQMNGTTLADIENNRNWEELASRAAAKAEMALMSGFTTWRDMGGMRIAERSSNLSIGRVYWTDRFPRRF